MNRGGAVRIWNDIVIEKYADACEVLWEFSGLSTENTPQAERDRWRAAGYLRELAGALEAKDANEKEAE